MIRDFGLAFAVLLLATSPVRSEVYELPPEGFDVIGAVSTVTARARRYARRYRAAPRTRLPGYRTRESGRECLGAGRGHRDRIADALRIAAGTARRAGAESCGIPHVLLSEAEERRARPMSTLSNEHRTYGLGDAASARPRSLRWRRIRPGIRHESVREEHAADGDPLPASCRRARTIHWGRGHCVWGFPVI